MKLHWLYSGWSGCKHNPKFMIELRHQQNCSQEANSCSLVVSCNLISYPMPMAKKYDENLLECSRDGRMFGAL